MQPAGNLDLLLMLLLGLTSSLHCVTMCGPLIAVASAPLAEMRSAASTRRLILWQVLYHLGRGAAYLFAGGVLGWTGQSLTALFATRLVGGIIQLSIGLIIVTLGIWQLRRSRAVSTAGGGSFSRLVGRMVTSGRSVGLLGLGLLTGLLPCGVLYAAFARAVASRSIWEGGALMLAFWLGTVPLLAVVGLASSHFLRAGSRVISLLLCLALLSTGGWLGYKGIRNIAAPPTQATRASCHGDHLRH